MAQQTYKLTEAVGGFSAGELLDVTARFGDWHHHVAELEARTQPRASTPKLVVTDDPAGFTEAEILDPTARFGDWHELELQFTPGEESTTGDTVAITMRELEQIAEPVSA